MVGNEFDELVLDIREHGLRDPITLHPDSSILDGRNRYRACERLGVTPRYVTWQGQPGSEMAFVISGNLRRRHLDASQRAMVAAKIATLKQGGDRKSNQSANLRSVPTHAEAAALLNVSERSVDAAARVRDEAPREIIQAVERGEVSVHRAVEQLKEQEPRLSKNGRRLPTVTPKREKFEAMQREHARYWRAMSDAIEGVLSLPLADDVAKGCVAPAHRQATALKISRAIAWLNNMERVLKNVSSDAAA